jgi:F-type H+-transporting ATPase subunit epsilon
MTDGLRLTITTPTTVLVDSADVASVRAEDESGGFGILPGHADLLTVLPASVVRWRERSGATRFCAVRGGVFIVSGGERVAIACRQGTTGDDLSALETDVRKMRKAEAEADKSARVEQMRLHAHAVRQLMRYLRPDRPSEFGSPPGSIAP